MPQTNALWSAQAHMPTVLSNPQTVIVKGAHRICECRYGLKPPASRSDRAM